MSNVHTKKRAWRPLTDVSQRQAVEQRVKSSVELLRDATAVKQLASQETVEIEGVQMEIWSDLSLTTGYPGLCLLFGELDRLEQAGGWDLAGHRMLVGVQQALSRTNMEFFGLWTGFAGVMMGIRALSRGGTRYAGMMTSLNAYAAQHLPHHVERMTEHMGDDLRVTDYDLMAGVTGIARYLLAYRDEPALQPSLEMALRYLILLSGDKEMEGQVVPMWHVSAQNQNLPSEREKYKQGNCNLGLSHGVAGPMGLLAVAKLAGVELEGQEAAIRRYAEWLLQWMLEDEAGPYWPGRIPAEVVLHGWQEENRIGPQESWCYGTAGLARQFWLAGEALGEEGWKQIAVEAALATLRRPVEKRGLKAPNFCHGLAGLAHAMQVMYSETGNEAFAQERDLLVAQMLELYDEELPFGIYDLHNVEGSLQKQSTPGLLSGLTGTLLVMTSLLAEDAPEWDAVFLMS